MKIELTNPVEMRAFDLIHPASCFIPLGKGQQEAPRARNVWLKFAAPLTDQAVNLYSGAVMNIQGDTLCEPVSAKVVVE